MIKKLKKEKKYLGILLFLCLGIIFLYYLPALKNSVAYVQGTDLRSQWYEFYFEFKRLIKDLIVNHNLPFYSWTTFLGNNFYASKGYYLIGDIYNYIGLFLSDNFFVMAEELTALKMLVSSFTFYLFLTEFDRKPISKIICSLAYAFSGFAIFFSEQMVFLSFYSLVPLYLLAIERYLKYNKWQLFSAMCGVLFATNFYLFYTLSALTPLYFIYRYFSLEKEKKDFFTSVIKIIGYYLLGSIVTSFLWLPSVLYILSGNGRFLENIGLFHSTNVYINYLISFFVPNYLYLNRGNMFDTFVYYNREICCWASTVLIILVPQFIKLLNKSRKMLTLGMYGFFTLIALFPILCSIFHGFSDPSFRWTFFVINFNLLIISEVLDNINLIDYKLLVKTVIIFTLIILFGYFYGVYTNGYIGNYLNQLKLICISIAVMFVAMIMYKFKKTSVILSIVVLEIVTNILWFNINEIRNNRYVENETMYRTILQNHYGEVNDYFNTLDENNSYEFYRVYIDMNDVYFGFSFNANILYGIKGLATYDTTYTPSTNKLIDLVGEVNHYYLPWIIDVENYDLIDFLNTKYAITTAQHKMDLDKWELIDDNYGWGYYVYQNKSYTKFGVAYDMAMTEDEYKKINKPALFNQYVIGNKKTIDAISSYLTASKVEFNNINYQGNHLYSNYYSTNDGFALISIPYDEGWKILVDGQEIDYYNVNGGFIGFKTIQGNHNLDMYFIPRGLKPGMVLSFAGVIMFIVLTVMEKKKYEL